MLRNHLKEAPSDWTVADIEDTADRVDCMLLWLIDESRCEWIDSRAALERSVVKEGQCLSQRHCGRDVLIEAAALIATWNPDDRYERAALLQELWFEP
jgi:hypothetical protein